LYGFTGFTRLPRGFRTGFTWALRFYAFVGKNGILTCLTYVGCQISCPSSTPEVSTGGATAAATMTTTAAAAAAAATTAIVAFAADIVATSCQAQRTLPARLQMAGSDDEAGAEILREHELEDVAALRAAHDLAAAGPAALALAAGEQAALSDDEEGQEVLRERELEDLAARRAPQGSEGARLAQPVQAAVGPVRRRLRGKQAAPAAPAAPLQVLDVGASLQVLDFGACCNSWLWGLL